MDRHGRQIRLTEVGSAGQARLARARVEVSLDGLAGEVAARYLAGAGVGQVCVTNATLAEAARAIDPGVNVAVIAGIALSPWSEFDAIEGPARELARGAL